jgi:hypothetical protein
MTKTVDYFLSPVSPWTYLGHERLREMCRRHGARINVRPCDLGGKIFPVSGGLPLKQRAPQRQAYRMAELKRWRAYLDIPLTLEPKYFPADGEPASRLIIAASRLSEDAAMALAGAALRACWAEERNIADADTLKAILEGGSGPRRCCITPRARRRRPLTRPTPRRPSRRACSVRRPTSSTASCSGGRIDSSSSSGRWRARYARQPTHPRSGSMRMASRNRDTRL